MYSGKRERDVDVLKEVIGCLQIQTLLQFNTWMYELWRGSAREFARKRKEPSV
jgi:hypothetical protein